MTEAVICEPVQDAGRALRRHVQGRARSPRSRPRSSRDLSSAPGSPPGDIDDVIFGQGYAER